MFLKVVKMTQIVPKSMDCRPWFCMILDHFGNDHILLVFCLKDLRKYSERDWNTFQLELESKLHVFEIVKMTQITPKRMDHRPWF